MLQTCIVLIGLQEALHKAFQRQGATKQVTLSDIHASRLQPFQLFFFFNALSNDPQLEPACELNYPATYQ